ncbi:MAG: carbon-nitrogen hydrolase family protein [Alphaproteobacteria bacterium]
MEPFRAACVQMCTGLDISANTAQALDLIREAHGRDARLVMTPENTTLLEGRRKALFDKVSVEAEDPSLAAFRAIADDLDLWLLIGSIPVRVGRERVANRSFLIGPDGAVAARYDKIHLFDVTLADGTTFRESATYAAGREAVAAALPWGVLGLTICYDVRFPALYRLLARVGAQFLTCPSAFTVPTGEAHWHVLLRARAIENGAYLFAPAQSGRHESGRVSYGHSLIVDPWGEVVADAGPAQNAVITAMIDPARVHEARSQLPVLLSERPIALAG